MKIKKKNNKARKRQWIRARNLMRAYPDCAYNGDFYCNHVYDKSVPWNWVDFRFFHSTSKKYYAVSMITATYKEYEDGAETICEPHVSWNASKEMRLAREARVTEKLFKYFEHPIKTNPNFELKDYGLPAIGIWAVIDAPFIDEHEIRKFIAFFKSLGEPTIPGFKWIGEEIEVDPKKLIRRNKAS